MFFFSFLFLCPLLLKLIFPFILMLILYSSVGVCIFILAAASDIYDFFVLVFLLNL